MQTKRLRLIVELDVEAVLMNGHRATIYNALCNTAFQEITGVVYVAVEDVTTVVLSHDGKTKTGGCAVDARDFLSNNIGDRSRCTLTEK